MCVISISASKHACELFASTLRQEMRAFGVKVSKCLPDLPTEQ